MKVFEQQPKYEVPEINMLKKWLFGMNGECRAYIKGASKALLYVQERPEGLPYPGNAGFEQQRGGGY